MNDVRAEKQNLRELKSSYRSLRADQKQDALTLTQRIAASKARIKLLKVERRAEKLRGRSTARQSMGRM